MRGKVDLIVGMLWASPITAVCFIFYVLPFWVLGWYRYVGFYETAWVWKLQETAPSFVHKLWSGWAGHALGNLVVMIEEPDISRYTGVILTHELQHVDQCMRLGIFQPIMYGLNNLIIRFGCKNSHPYYDNPFEIDARRGAGQIIDVKARKLSDN